MSTVSSRSDGSPNNSAARIAGENAVVPATEHRHSPSPTRRTAVRSKSYHHEYRSCRKPSRDETSATRLRSQTPSGLHDFARLRRELAEGGDPIFHGAPVVVVAHAPKGDTFGRDNCLYAVSNVMLEATARGLGTCLIGYFIAAWGFRPALRRALGLPQGQRAYAAFTLGVPAVRHRLAPPRRPIPVAWGR